MSPGRPGSCVYASLGLGACNSDPPRYRRTEGFVISFYVGRSRREASRYARNNFVYSTNDLQCRLGFVSQRHVQEGLDTAVSRRLEMSYHHTYPTTHKNDKQERRAGRRTCTPDSVHIPTGEVTFSFSHCNAAPTSRSRWLVGCCAWCVCIAVKCRSSKLPPVKGSTTQQEYPLK